MKQAFTRLLPIAAGLLLCVPATQAQTHQLQVAGRAKKLLPTPIQDLLLPPGTPALRHALPGGTSLSEKNAAVPTRSLTRSIKQVAGVTTGAKTLASGPVSEEWVSRFTGPSSFDGTKAMAVDAAGNVYVTGYSLGKDTGYDYVIIKYSPTATVDWERRYNGPANKDDVPSAITLSPTGGVSVTGSSYNGTTWDYTTIRYSSTGQQQWVTRYNGPANSDDLAASVAVDAAGNVLVTGASYNGPTTSYDYVTLKYSATGQQQWETRYNGSGNSDELPTTLALDGSGNVYVTGNAYSGNQGDYLTLKYSTSGQQQWEARYNGPASGYDLARDMVVDAAGNVAVTGTSDDGTGNYDYATVRYATSGQQLWASRYSGAGNSYDEATAVAADQFGNVLVTGYANTGGDNWDYVTLKYAPNGLKQWENLYNGSASSYDEAKDVAVDAAGNVAVTGRSFNSSGLSEYATIKYAANGQTLWRARSGGVSGGDEAATAVFIKTNGEVTVTGTVNPSSNNSDFYTPTYSSSGQRVSYPSGPETTRNDCQASDMAVDAQGNVYVTGVSLNNINVLSTPYGFAWDIVTVKYSASGQQLWQARYATQASVDNPPHIAVDAVGNVSVAGRALINFAFSSDYLTIKYNGATGQQLWVKTYNGIGNGSDGVADVGMDAVGNVYVTGYSKEFGARSDYTTIKYSGDSGQPLWIRTYFLNGDEDDVPSALAVDAVGNVYVTGFSDGDLAATNYDFLTLKYSTSGEQLWVKTYNGTGARNSQEVPADLALDPEGNVAVTGRSYTSAGQSAYATVKYSASGQQLWVARSDRFGSASQQHGATAVAMDAAGNVAVTGNFYDNNGQIDYGTLKYASADGQQLWLTRYNGTGNGEDLATDITMDAAGNVFVTGSSISNLDTSPLTTKADYATLKYDGTSGQQLWEARYNGPANGTDLASSIALDAAGNVLVTGSSYNGLSIVYRDDFATIKYAQTNTSAPTALVAATRPALAASTKSLQELAVYPNPAAGQAAVSFRPMLDGPAQVAVYNQLGQQVASLYEGTVRKGQHYELPLHSHKLAPGLYTCSLLVGGQRETVRVLVAR
ncbi:SBBP repeat-containing protein [Hymenobacter volaticus]|uniref:T9SS type A sorting domain-containing protein n=1 Tax=Hymenobacter volaticus TaxID=2932254 RepID=A0ABY4G1H5_9BACT|nr:SBBP repeat-containing protein [Hymenobacter volaticus]UOQ64712.1 T9SS type A sorting domain-containing protein [Hymenobacter volaticus]